MSHKEPETFICNVVENSELEICYHIFQMLLTEKDLDARRVKEFGIRDDSEDI